MGGFGHELVRVDPTGKREVLLEDKGRDFTTADRTENKEVATAGTL